MYNRKIQTILILSALLLSAFALPGFKLPRAHAAGSLFIDPATVAVASAGSAVTFSVKVSGIDSFNGWDVSVRADSSTLSAVSISKTGSLATGTITEFVNCINGVGNGCGINDGDGVVHSAVTFSTPTAAGASGLLFTISYLALNGAPGSIITPFADVIASAGTPVSHTTSRAVYGTPNPTFTVDVSAPTDQNGNTPQPGSDAQSVIVLTSFGALADSISLSLSSQPAVSDFVAPPTVDLPASGTVSSTISIHVPTTTLPGTYHQTVTATGVGSGIVQTADLAILVASGASVSVTCGSNLSVVQGATAANPISLTSQNGFFGGVFLSTVVSPSTSAPTATTDPASLTLGAGTTGGAVLYVSAGSTAAVGSYTVTLAASFGTGSNTCSIMVNVLAAGTPDFSLTSSDSSITAIRTVVYKSTITVVAGTGFTGTVATSAIVLPLVAHGPAVSVTAVSGGTATLTFTSSATAQTTTYKVIVIGSSGSQSHSIQVLYNLEDYGIALRGAGNFPEFHFTATTCEVGLYSIGSINGFSGVVTITRFRMVNINTGDIGFPTGVTVTFNDQPIVVGQTSLNVLSGGFVAGPLKICTTADTPGGEYQLQTRGTTVVNGLKVTHSRNAFVQINSFDLVPDTGFVVVLAKSSATVGISVVGSFVEDLCCSAGFGTLPFLDFVTLSVTSITPSPGAFAKVTASIAPGPFFATDLINPSTPLTINVGPGGPGGLFFVTVTGVAQSTPALVRSTTIIVSVPSVLASINSASVTTSPGLATFTASISNSATTTQFMQVVCSVVSTTPGGSVYAPSSSVVSIAAGGTATLTFTQALSAGDSGQTFNFLCRATSGSAPDQLLFISKNKAAGSFTAI